jgi:hypothetical protein
LTRWKSGKNLRGVLPVLAMDIKRSAIFMGYYKTKTTRRLLFIYKVLLNISLEKIRKKLKNRGWYGCLANRLQKILAKGLQECPQNPILGGFL